MNKNLFYFLISIMFLSLNVFANLDLPFNKYYARVKSKDINVRARSTTSSEIMYKLKKGEDILIIHESGDWVKIAPKEGYYAWIHKDMVENDIIMKKNVNVRTAPSLESSVLGKLTSGTPIIPIKTEGEWIQIEMPRGFGFWVAKFLIKFLCPQNSYQEYILKERMAREDFKKAEEARREELKKRYVDIDYNKLIEMYQKIIDEYPDTSESLKAHERIIDAREKRSMAKQKEITIKELKRILKLYDEADLALKRVLVEDAVSEKQFNEVEDKFKYIISQYPSSKEARLSIQKLDELKNIKETKIHKWQELMTYEANGKIKVYKNTDYVQATHKLVKGGFSSKIICAIFSKKIDIRAYDKKLVTIKGKIIKKSDDLVDYPLIEIETIMLK